MCFAGVFCTQAPTASPTTASPTTTPSFTPSSQPSTSSPTRTPSKVALPVAPGPGTSSSANNAPPPAANNDNASPSGGWLESIGFSKAPTDPPQPTRAPFDFNNTHYCGADWTDALTNCYTNIPCPSASPEVCEPGQTCYPAITCEAPPSLPPTPSPISAQTPSSQESSPSSASSPSNPSPSSPANPSPSSPPEGGSWGSATRAPFDELLFQNSHADSFTRNVMPGVIVQSIVVAVGFTSML